MLSFALLLLQPLSLSAFIVYENYLVWFLLELIIVFGSELPTEFCLQILEGNTENIACIQGQTRNGSHDIHMKNYFLTKLAICIL